MGNRAEELITQLEAEIAQRDARIAELEAQAGDGTSGNKYRAELYDEVWQAARDMGYGNVTGALQDLAALKAQQPSAGVACALMSALEGIVHDQRVPNEVSQECAAVLIEARRLNPCRVQAVPDGYVLVPVEPTEIMQDAGCAAMPTVDCHPYDAGMVYKAMLAAAPSTKKESE